MLVLTGRFFGSLLPLAIALGRMRAIRRPTCPMWGRLPRCTSYGAGFAGAVDAAKRAAKFLHHGIKSHFERGAPSDQHVIVAGLQQSRWRKPNELAQPAPHTVALDGIADLFADRETNARRAALPTRTGLQDKAAGMSTRAGPGSLGNGPKLTPPYQPLHCRDFGVTGLGDPLAIDSQPKYRAGRAQALSRLRPRARRAAKTLRPPLFAMRARKPCRRLRTSLLG
jgi:hypothetical protein